MAPRPSSPVQKPQRLLTAMPAKGARRTAAEPIPSAGPILTLAGRSITSSTSLRAPAAVVVGSYSSKLTAAAVEKKLPSPSW